MTSIYTKIISNVIFPIHERLKGHNTVQVRKQLDETQWWSTEQISTLQVSKLINLLAHSNKHVPYYHDLFKRLSFDPQRISSVKDISCLPFLTKKIIRENQDLLKSDIAHDLARFNTGGSSGEPLIFYIGKERVSHDVAAKWRATCWWGVDIGDREIVVWGSPIELGAQDRVRITRDRLLRTELLPAFEMSEEKLNEFVATIRRFRPKMIFGYPSSLSLIAKHAEANGQSLDKLGIKVAFVTSERLYEEQRNIIEKTFACPVANGYGGRDAGFIAHQCPSGNMHITAEDIIVEIVDKSGVLVEPGNPGEIVVTHLNTKDFPFIRYRTGDIGVMDYMDCPCGRGLPVLKEIQGRATDFVVSSNGTIMHGLALIYILRDLPGIKAFKIVQESLKQTCIFLEKEDTFDDGLISEIKNGFKKRLGEDVEIRINIVKEIPRENSGKFRFIESKVGMF